MNQLTERIKEFALATENIEMSYALLKVGRDKGKSAENIMATLLAHALLKFNHLPIPKIENN